MVEALTTILKGVYQCLGLVVQYYLSPSFHQPKVDFKEWWKKGFDPCFDLMCECFFEEYVDESQWEIGNDPRSHRRLEGWQSDHRLSSVRAETESHLGAGKRYAADIFPILRDWFVANQFVFEHISKIL